MTKTQGQFEKRPRDLSGEGNPSFKHGANRRGKRTTEYKIWVGIRARVNNPKNKIYPYYGGRGISYDPAWEDFQIFLQEVGERPSLEYSLDRVDNEKGYYKSNVKWATKAEQARNKRSNIWVEGKILKDWCQEKGFNYKTVWRWIKEGFDLGLLEERASKIWAK